MMQGILRTFMNKIKIPNAEHLWTEHISSRKVKDIQSIKTSTITEKIISLIDMGEYLISENIEEYEKINQFIQKIEIPVWSVTQTVIKKTCGLCGEPTERLVQHHYSYFPEKIIYVCPSCNHRSNLEQKHPLLNPSIEDANKFYGRDTRNDEQEN
jgi:hypothetical protein